MNFGTYITKYYQGDKIMEDRIGATRNGHGRDDKNAYKILVGKPNRKDHSQDLGVDGRKILELILENRVAWSGFIWLRIETGGELL
jgi:hypothetical protein